MDESNSGPVPGIIGQDVPSEPVETMPTPAPAPAEPQDNGKIFDSSEFTGVKQESISFNADGEEKNTEADKPKGSNPLTKWQIWAATSGVILAAAIAAVFVTIAIYDGKLNNANAVARYDSLSSSIDSEKKEFDRKITEYTKIVYSNNIDTINIAINPASAYAMDTENYIYPTDNDIHMAGNNCLKQSVYGLTDEDIAYIETHKTGAELQSMGKDVVKEAERLEKIENAYRSANADIETCHDPLINVKLDDFKIELSDATYDEKGDDVDVRRKIKITYNGEKDLKSFSLIYGMQDKNGLTKEFHFASYTGKTGPIKKGDIIETRVCGYKYSISTSTDSCVYTVSAKDLKAFKAMTPKLLTLSGKYASSWDYKTVNN
jgi:hypothetical protein